ncbi:MAG TPA: hypothetical protein VL588_07935, partial [Bdellovibrionota bacterium]|nr:hypothetical protein [Bdellovibrionota bacterium]
GGFYRLTSAQPCFVRLGGAEAKRPPTVLRRVAEGAHKNFGSETFSSVELGRALAKSTRTAVNYARRCVEAGLFEASGEGPARRYRARDAITQGGA